MNRVIEYLQVWKAELVSKINFSSAEEKADHLGLISSVEVAIKQIELCQLYGINQSSWFCVFPDKVSGYGEPMFRVVCDNETHQSTSWTELNFPERGKVTFHSGDLAIKR